MFSSIFGTSYASDADELRKPNELSVSDTSSDDSFSADGDVSALQEKFPALSERDCARFKENFMAEDGSEDDVIQKLEEYLKFRAMYGLDSQENWGLDCTDEEDWDWASRVAVEAATSRKQDLIPGLEGLAFEDRVCEMQKLPQLCYAHTNQDGTPAISKEGNPVIHYLSARLDLDAVSEEIHALAIALYLERKSRKLDFDAKGALLLVDVRQGAGWPNHNVLKVVSFLRTLTNALTKVHPSRMEKFIIYPVPYACVYVFTMMKSFLPTSVAESITLMNGGDGIHDPAPKAQLVKFVDEDLLDKMEVTREENFNE